ncbi:MAG: hypothetical protein IPG76_23900 [Acidobacteria bacterium]|nr:hypothetical protein [Acidobacteriota bacterium]
MKRIDSDAGWTNLKGIHLTLKFLGEIDEALLPEIANCCRAAVADAERFTLTLTGPASSEFAKSHESCGRIEGG